MASEYVQLEVFPTTTRWWALVIRGLAAIAFGVLTFVKPSISLLALVILWGAYAIVDGVFSIVLSIRGARVVSGWGWLLAEGIVSIAAGAVTFLWPGTASRVRRVLRDRAPVRRAARAVVAAEVDGTTAEKVNLTGAGSTSRSRSTRPTRSGRRFPRHFTDELPGAARARVARRRGGGDHQA